MVDLFRSLIKHLFCFLVILQFLVHQKAGAQNFYSFNQPLEIKFLKDSIETQESKFIFNNASIKNTSLSAISFSTLFDYPCFLNVLTSDKNNYTLQPQEQIIIPLRFIGNLKTSCKIDWLPFTISLVNSTNTKIASGSFLAKPVVSLKWKSYLMTPTLIIPEENKQISFFIKIENNGNILDNYLLEFKSNIALNISNNKLSQTLKPGENKAIEIKVNSKGAELQKMRNEDITITIENGAGDKKVLVQKITKIGNIYSDAGDRWMKMPLTAEVNTMNINSVNPLVFFKLYGILDLAKDRKLSLNYQSDNFFEQVTNNNGILNLTYSDLKWDISAGTHIGFNNFLINGDGLSINRKFLSDKDSKEKFIEASYIKSRFGNTDQFGLKFQLPVANKLTLNSNNFSNLDNTQNIYSYFSQNKFLYEFSPTFKMSLDAGLGFEKINKVLIDTSIASTYSSLRVEKAAGNLILNSSFSIYSKNFPGLNKGLTQFQSDIRYNLKNTNIGLSLDFSKHLPTLLYKDSILNSFYNFKNTEISARFGYTKNAFSISLLPGVFIQQQDSVNAFKTLMKKIASQIFYNSKNLQANNYNNLGWVTIPELHNINTFLSMNNITSIQYKSFGLFTRIDIGPYYYFEIKEYTKNQTPFSRIQVSPYHSFFLKKQNITIRNQINFTNTKPLNQNFSFLTTNVSWNAVSSGIGAAINSNIDLQSGKTSTLNIVFRKTFNAPVFPKKGLKNFKVVLFMDIDNNGIFSKSDETINLARLNVNDVLIETNSLGEATVKNYKSNQLKINLSQIRTLKGWIPVLGFDQSFVIKDNKTIYIPFKKGKSISGRLVVDKDDKSDIVLQIGSIRVTATSKDGTVYSTLTDVEGNFFLNLPEDQYIVTFNQNAIDEKFKATEPVKSVNLIENETDYVEFIIKQKRREIKIKKQ